MCKSETKTPPKPSTTPSSSKPAGGTAESCHPACTLSSQTVATSPANRARKKIGVGEEVKLTVKGNPATWTLASGTGTLSPAAGAQASVKFTADDKAGSVTIKAVGSGCSCSNSITLTIVKPSDWTMKRQPNTKLKHTKGWPDCGWKGIMYVHPDDVNFYRIETREKDSLSVADGSYTDFNGVYHGNYPLPDQASVWFAITRHSETDGSTDDAPDEIYSGYTGEAATGKAPPFKVGKMHFPITIQWRITGGATIHDFPIIRQEHEIFTTGKCESRKGGLTEKTEYNDPTSTF
jgi:type VI secretion system secreted protein VgrG